MLRRALSPEARQPGIELQGIPPEGNPCSRALRPKTDARPFARTIAAVLALTAAAFSVAPNVSAVAQEIDTRAKNAIVVDYTTGAVLFEKGSDEAIHPASMSKLMTVEMAFHALSQGRLQLDETFPVSEAAYQKEGSTMFLDLRDRPTVEDLLRGIIVVSGNDACIVLAEALAGTEEAFSRRMTERGADIGRTDSVFLNSTGLPAEGHRMTVRDLATLGAHLIREYPEHYFYFAEPDFKWGAPAAQKNRNQLLFRSGSGVDGLKTGHTEDAGYGIVTSAEREGRRIIAVVAGLDTARERTQEMERLLSWAFREFRLQTLAKEGDIVGEAEVWIGAASTVPLAITQDLTVAMPWVGEEDTKAVLIYDGPISAPVRKGDPIGVLRISIPGVGPVETDVVAAEDVAEGGYMSRLGAGAQFLLNKLMAEISS